MCWSVGGIGNIEHSFSESSYIQFDYAGQITLVFVIHNVKHFLFCYEYDIKLATACKKHYAIYFFETFRFAPVFLLLLLDRQKKKERYKISAWRSLRAPNYRKCAGQGILNRRRSLHTGAGNFQDTSQSEDTRKLQILC